MSLPQELKDCYFPTVNGLLCNRRDLGDYVEKHDHYAPLFLYYHSLTSDADGGMYYLHRYTAAAKDKMYETDIPSFEHLEAIHQEWLRFPATARQNFRPTEEARESLYSVVRVLRPYTIICKPYDVYAWCKERSLNRTQLFKMLKMDSKVAPWTDMKRSRNDTIFTTELEDPRTALDEYLLTAQRYAAGRGLFTERTTPEDICKMKIATTKTKADKILLPESTVLEDSLFADMANSGLDGYDWIGRSSQMREKKNHPPKAKKAKAKAHKGQRCELCRTEKEQCYDCYFKEMTGLSAPQGGGFDRMYRERGFV